MKNVEYRIQKGDCHAPAVLFHKSEAAGARNDLVYWGIWGNLLQFRESGVRIWPKQAPLLSSVEDRKRGEVEGNE
jgi:hypothetical protein